jgi:hypothetical protein
MRSAEFDAFRQTSMRIISTFSQVLSSGEEFRERLGKGEN